MNLRFAMLALVQILLLPHLLCAQLPPRLQRCLPYPTLAQEISGMQEETSSPEAEPSANPRVVVASVQFAPETHISESVRNRIIWAIKLPQYYDSGLDWLQEMQEVGIRGTLQDLGYFRAKVKAGARLLDGNERRNRYVLTLHIEEGWQYRLGDVRFQRAMDDNPLVFSTSELRNQVPMRSGEVFNVSKVREGLDKITKLYTAKGYIDMVPVPDTLNDEDGGSLDLVFRIDEGKQYRVGSIEFLGLDGKTQEELKVQLKRGEPYNSSLVDMVLRQYKSLLPADASRQDVSLTRNSKEGVVDMRFDFFTCPHFNN